MWELKKLMSQKYKVEQRMWEGGKGREKGKIGRGLLKDIKLSLDKRSKF